MKKRSLSLLLSLTLVFSLLAAPAKAAESATRAEAAQAVYTLAGKPAVSDADRKTTLTDVAGLDESDALYWARANGLMLGVGENRMTPNASLTWQQLVTVLYRYAKIANLPLTKRDDAAGKNAFKWADDAASWASAYGILPKGANLNANVSKAELKTAVSALSSLPKDPVAADLNAILNDSVAPIAGFAVMAYRDGKLIYQRTGGDRYIDANDSSKNLPLELDSRYRTASISKVFATVGAMRLVEQGKLDLDEDVSTYLGYKLRNPNYPDIAITTRMLLSHTSSLRDGSLYSIPPEYSLREFFFPDGKFWLDGEHFADTEDGVACKPGEYFCYCNLNFALVGTIIEQLSGQRFDIYMKQNVLEPMGIKASYNPGDFDAEELDNIATLYQKMNKNVWNVNGPYIAQIDDYRNGETADRDKVVVTNPVLQAENGDLVASVKDYKVGTNGSLFSPQGGLRVSPNVMKTLIEMFLNDGKVNGKQILTKESVNEMFTPVWTYNDETKNGHTSGLFYSYGLGIQTMSSTHYDRLLKDRDVVLAGHFGEAYGLLAGMFMDRSTGTVIYYAMTGMGSPEDENYGEYSGMYKWEEKFCTALLNDLFPEL